MNTGQKTGKGPNSGLSNLIDEQTLLPRWEAIHATQWWKDMALCMQEPEFHAEGDVATHTTMVVDALHALEEFQVLDVHAKKILTVSALLHDIAKPICTVVENGRISSPRHAKVGEGVARELLWDVTLETREQIASLVRLHGLPLWVMEKSNPYSAAIGASLRMSNHWLYLLAKADVLGRICADQEELLERVEMFRAFCIEQKCYWSAYEFENEHSKFHYFSMQCEFPSQLYDNTQFTVELLSGIAGSGKDTYLRNNDKPVISLDALRLEMKVSHNDSRGQGLVINKAYDLAKKYAAAKQSFVWNSTNLTSDMRSKLIRTLSVYNPRFEITYIETSMANIFQRRKGEIPKASLEKMIRILDMPLPSEAHSVKYLRN